MSTPAHPVRYRRPSHTTELVLFAFHHTGRPMYGGEIARAGELDEGTVKRILERLQRDGWATAAEPVRSPSGPPRHYFELTDQGRKVAADAFERMLQQSPATRSVDVGLGL